MTDFAANASTLRVAAGALVAVVSAASMTGGCAGDGLAALTPCEADEERVDGICVPLCDEGYAYEDGECLIVCPSGYERDGEGGCRRVCPSGWEVVGTDCLPACPEGTERDGEVCRTACPDGEIRVGNECQVPCEEGYERIDGICTLVCTPPLQPVGGHCILVCPDGYVPLDGECVLSCPDGFEDVDGVCLEECEAGWLRNGTECVLDCPDDTEIIDDTCVPFGGFAGLICNDVTGAGGGIANVIVKVVLADGTILSAVTGADGSFSLPGVPSGFYVLGITYPDGTLAFLTLDVQAGVTTWVGPDECPPLVELCDNGTDDDRDALADCLDPDCFGTLECVEYCNGLDDNGNGDIDEDPIDPELGTSCYEGPADTEGVGVCKAGIIICSPDGDLVCDRWVGPADEVCDQLDNDCDGEVPLFDAIAGTPLSDVRTQVEVPSVDILFVVDNSSSMREEQISLGANFSTFINRFIAAGNIDYQIGVITTDIGEGGHLVAPIITPLTVNAATAFSNAVNVGITGSQYEQGLAASYLALSAANVGPGGANEGFLRSNALLSIIYVSDEDDQSPETVSYYADALRAYKGNEAGAVLMAAIAGDVPLGCVAGVQQADAGLRYDAIVADFEGLFLSICALDWGVTMDAVAADTLAALTTFHLSYAADPSTLVVRVCNAGGACTIIPFDPVNGWTYDASTASIVFHGSAVPDAGEQITVEYDAACVVP